MLHFRPATSEIIYEQAPASTGIVKNHVHKTPTAKSAYDHFPASGVSAFAASCTVAMLCIHQLKSIVPAVSMIKKVARLEKIIPAAFPFLIRFTLFFSVGNLW